jgi:hypothetical protein
MKPTRPPTSAAVPTVSVVRQTVQHHRVFHQLHGLGVEGILFWKPPFVSVPHQECAYGASCGYDILSVSPFEVFISRGKEGHRHVCMHEHAVPYVQGVHNLGQREAPTSDPREPRSGGLFLCLWSMELLRSSRSTLFLRFVLRHGESFRSGSRSRCTHF